MSNHFIDRIRILLIDSAFDRTIDLYAKKTKNLFFVQIGACDGIQNDPIHDYIIKYRWKGILIEPVKELFAKLVQNYKDQSNLIFENVAISDKCETRDIYRLKITEESLPEWQQELASFSLNTVLKHEYAIPNIRDRIVKEKVKCTTLEGLLAKHGLKEMDLLQIDVEGYEFEIIKTLDFSIIKPKIIRYEHKHLRPEDKIRCEEMLKRNGYNVIEGFPDTLAFQGLCISAFQAAVSLPLYVAKKIFKRCLGRLKLR